MTRQISMLLVGVMLCYSTAAQRTGRTTGHIGDYYYFNNTSEPVTLSLGPALIPGINGTQDMLLLRSKSRTVQPGSGAILTMTGFCTNVFAPVNDASRPFATREEWIQPGEVPKPGKGHYPPSSFQPLPENRLPEVRTTYPGTTTPFPYQCNDLQDPAVAGLILDVVERTGEVVSEMQRTGRLHTYLSEDPESEQRVIQQLVVWRYTAGIQDLDYNDAHFREQSQIQLTEVSGFTPTSEQAANLDAAYDNLWNVVSMVGAGAKVLVPTEPVPVADTPCLPDPDDLTPEPAPEGYRYVGRQVVRGYTYDEERSTYPLERPDRKDDVIVVKSVTIYNEAGDEVCTIIVVHVYEKIQDISKTPDQPLPPVSVVELPFTLRDALPWDLPPNGTLWLGGDLKPLDPGLAASLPVISPPRPPARQAPGWSDTPLRPNISPAGDGRKIPVPELPKTGMASNGRTTGHTGGPYAKNGRTTGHGMGDIAVLTPPAISTGLTTGVIATIPYHNTTDQPVTIPETSVIIPPTGDGQAYWGRIAKTTVAGGAEGVIEVTGNCLNIHQAPVTAGSALTDVGTWILQSDAGPAIVPGQVVSAQYAKAHPGMEHLGGVPRGSGFVLCYPGTSNIPFPFTIDYNAYTAEAAPMLFAIHDRIAASTEHLVSEGQVTVPLPPQRAAAELEQQAVWFANALLEGAPYTRDQFAGRMAEQFRSNTGVPIDAAAPELQQQFHTGVDQIWSAVEQIAAAAQVVTSVPEPSQPVEQRPEEPQTNPCCDQIRSREGGRLQFDLQGGGYVRIRSNMISFRQGSHGPAQTFRMDFNAEEVFCGLRANPGQSAVFGEILQRNQLRLHNGREVTSTRDGQSITMGYVPGEGGLPGRKTLRFSRSELRNGRLVETSVSLLLLEGSCSADIQILSGNELMESAGAPLPYDQLVQVARNLGTPETNSNYWNNVYFLLSQVQKLETQYGTNSRQFQNLMQQLRQKLSDPLFNLKNQSADPGLREAAGAAYQAAGAGQSLQELTEALMNPDLLRHAFTN